MRGPREEGRSRDAARPGEAAAAGEEAPGRRRPELAERFADRIRISVPARHNPVLAGLVERVNEHDELYALWVSANVNAVDRLGISDHGPVHVQIVANSALRLLRLLVDAGIEPSVRRDYGLDRTDAEVVVVLAALVHDLGISIHRDGHEAYSLFVAQPVLRDLLATAYDPPVDTILRSEVLHAVIAHRAGGEPRTLEAGILKVADALDMAEGRSRIPFEAGSMSIHSVSAAAIEAVHIEPGESVPVRIRIDMTNSAGVFQVDELLRRKLRGSGLEDYLQVEAHIEGETEKRLVERFQL
ncbi:MAG TPA: HD domain-containing protein [Gemmatimonadota bacterium]|nr:HD domain-containing protein [Gemmatimonadota bacterium]